jgi:MFS family permease
VAAVPGALAVVVAVLFVRELPAAVSAAVWSPIDRGTAPVAAAPLPRRFWHTVAPILLFTLGNSTDAFLLLRASQVGVPTALVPLLWVALHVVKSASSTPGGALSDRVGRRPLILAGWLLYAAVYCGFALATEAWHAWALFAIYGVVFGLTEGTEKAFVADLVPAERRGTAFGWYHGLVGLAALPASVVFGAVWDAWSSATAFMMGAGLAVAAALWLALLPPAPRVATS